MQYFDKYVDIKQKYINLKNKFYSQIGGVSQVLEPVRPSQQQVGGVNEIRCQVYDDRIDCRGDQGRYNCENRKEVGSTYRYFDCDAAVNNVCPEVDERAATYYRKITDDEGETFDLLVLPGNLVDRENANQVYENNPGCVGWYNEARMNNPNYKFVVLRSSSGQFVGLAGIDGNTKELRDDCIRTDYQGRGLYSRLLRKRVEYVNEHLPDDVYYLFTNIDRVRNSHIRSGLQYIGNTNDRPDIRDRFAIGNGYYIFTNKPEPEFGPGLITRDDIFNQSVEYRIQTYHRTGGTLPGNCTGLLVHPQLILTAGHCQTYRAPGERKDWIDNIRTLRGVNIDSDNSHYFQTEQFGRTANDLGPYDFAYIHFDVPVSELDVKEIPIISNPEDIPQGTPLFTSRRMDRAQPHECRKGTSVVFRNQQQFTETLDVSGCKSLPSDSGGPLYVQTRSGEWGLVGTLKVTGNVRSPQRTFQNVAFHLNWIRRQTGIRLRTIEY